MPEPAHIPEGTAIPELTAPPMGKTEVIDFAEVVSRRAEKFGQTIDTLSAGIATRGREAADSLARADYPPEAQAEAARKAEAKARKEVVTNSTDRRWDMLKELKAAEDTTRTTAALFASPQAVLARAGLGTTERTNFEAQLAGSGPAQLMNLATFAIATKNAVLGAALCAVCERMPRRDRPFSPADLADRLVGEETRAVQAAVETIRVAAQRAIVANREFERGRVNPLDRVKVALKSQKEAN